MVLSMRCRKYKGEAPNEYRLLRNPTTLTHTLLGNRPYADLLRIDAQSKVARIQEYNNNIDYRTAIKIAAAVDGVAEDTMKRRLGVKLEANEI